METAIIPETTITVLNVAGSPAEPNGVAPAKDPELQPIDFSEL